MRAVLGGGPERCRSCGQLTAEGRFCGHCGVRIRSSAPVGWHTISLLPGERATVGEVVVQGSAERIWEVAYREALEDARRGRRAILLRWEDARTVPATVAWVEVGADGSVARVEGPGAVPDAVPIRPPATAAPRPGAPATLRELGVQALGLHPLAGASTWASLLEIPEVVDADRVEQLLVVARTTLAGIAAAKQFTTRAGAVLLVEDAPGRLPTAVRRELLVLSGAAPVVLAPWMPALRGLTEAPAVPAVRKPAAKVAAELLKSWRNQ